MKINTNNVKLLVSAVKKEQYPATLHPEIALVGRSNVGKSSMINKILNRRNFARISSTPGKTATINFYEIDEKLMIVDLPGYGYASRSKDEIKKWGNMIEEYLNSRAQLSQVVLLVDSRHKPTKEDVMMLEWVRFRNEYAVVFATKCDKLSKKELNANLEQIIDTLELNEGDILIPFSTKLMEGADNFWEYIYGCVVYDEEDDNE